MTFATSHGEIEIVPANGTQVSQVRAALPLGLSAYAEPVDGAMYGIVLKRGDTELWGAKFQPPDAPAERLRQAVTANLILIALGFSGYRTRGFKGCLMPSAYYRMKGNHIEAGIACFGSSGEGEIKGGTSSSRNTFDQAFGHGFMDMLRQFSENLLESSTSSGIPMSPWIGLDLRPASHLENLSFSLLVHGGEIFNLRPNISEHDGTWDMLRSQGVERVFYLPCNSTLLEEDDG